MRKLVPVGVCLLLLFVGWAFGNKKGGGRDGTDWGTLTRSEQFAYVGGFADGYQQGASDYRSLSANTPSQKLTFSAQEARAILAPLPKQRTAVLFGDAGVNAGQIADTMSTFYRDFRNVRVCWNMALVVSIESLAGQPPTEQALDAARKAGAESGCK